MHCGGKARVRRHGGKAHRGGEAAWRGGAALAGELRYVFVPFFFYLYSKIYLNFFFQAAGCFTQKILP